MKSQACRRSSTEAKYNRARTQETRLVGRCGGGGDRQHRGRIPDLQCGLTVSLRASMSGVRSMVVMEDGRNRMNVEKMELRL